MSTVLCLVAQSCPTLCDPMDCSPPGSSVHGHSPGKNTGVGCHALLQGIFPTQGRNSGLPHCRLFLYHLSHQVSPLRGLKEVTQAKCLEYTWHMVSNSINDYHCFYSQRNTTKVVNRTNESSLLCSRSLLRKVTKAHS